MAKQWSEAKRRRYGDVNGRCEVCRRPVSFRNCVGHHKKNRSQGGPSTYANVEIRCHSCEQYMHKTYRWGNYNGRNDSAVRRDAYQAPALQLLLAWSDINLARPYGG